MRQDRPPTLPCIVIELPRAAPEKVMPRVAAHSDTGPCACASVLSLRSLASRWKAFLMRSNIGWMLWPKVDIMDETGGYARVHHPGPFLADAQRPQGSHHAGGMRAALRGDPREHRRGRAVPPRVPGDQPVQQDPRHRGPAGAGRQA